MAYGERKDALHRYEAMCNGSDDPLSESELECLKYIFTKESIHNMDFVEKEVKCMSEYVPKPVAEARAIGQLISGAMIMSELAPRLYATIIKIKSDPFEILRTFIRSLPNKKENGTVVCDGITYKITIEPLEEK